MCGRFTLISDLRAICERFECEPDGLSWEPHYNIAPGQPILSVLGQGRQRNLEAQLWGLIPHWSKSQKTGYHLINIRSDSMASKPYMKSLLVGQRCLIPADGFYEWRKSGTKKTPFRIKLKSQKLFAFAGVWDLWQDGDGKIIKSVAIVTTDATDFMKPIHERMPVILNPSNESVWLNPSIVDPSALLPILDPKIFPELDCYEVSPLVNSWKNDVPGCITPV